MRTVSAPIAERRAHTRSSENLRVLVSDPEDALNEPYPAWVVDRSPGGVRISFDSSHLDVGSELSIQASSSAFPVEVRVRNRRRREGRVELGCEFVEVGGEHALLVNHLASMRMMGRG